ncbi:Precorrin-8X methylmutase CbiC/CobH [Methanococcus vannielii SB]|jgi:precorrin-8X/cobalt-precorrin-8 methylmutase|uniref:Precorrin-8X methylmutase CbiC/CobH n=1 Tax=Methanococcus vannielii (strain ATCC 35089 / DSM 1224 / JCM 13029 / OCM 148 / SB) TaxID=406327 RepID=A6URW6_METVS|nr:cobalt-precorrin-8 methylmutase [Methanococcus vannielii]ABR55238.1 Precorrin-8X methylmutase CbiC/CobH [Methanococcus vannielii SB]
MGATTKDGMDIADKSREIVKRKIFEVLNEKIDLYSDEEMGLIERVVHATADPEYAKLILFNNGPIKNCLDALNNKKPIITDISMVKAGIRYNNIVCTISDKETFEYAKKYGITRAVASIRSLKDEIDGGIIVIGNAPTALLEVIRLYNEEKIRPKLVLGVPVGFVKASESKELLRTLNIPSISTIGPKGGTPIAVSLMNGIIALSKNERI